MVGFFKFFFSLLSMFYLVLDPTRKTTYVDAAWDVNWVEAYMDRLRNIVCLLKILKFWINLIDYLVVYELLHCVPGLEERRSQTPS